MWQAEESINTDILIIGGGLAGLTCSILLAKSGFKVLVVEKHQYPRHKVCGEYVAMESYAFLESLGLPLSTWHLPEINRLKVTHGWRSECGVALSPGGFGISRFKLEHELQKIAEQKGVAFKYDSVSEYGYNESGFHLKCQDKTAIMAKLCIGAFGKNMSMNLSKRQKSGLAWFGLKWHIKGLHPESEIHLHFFDGGYLGCSNIEDAKTNLCLLATKDALQKAGHSPDQFLTRIRSDNRHIESIFDQAEFLFAKPLSIGNVQFSRQVYEKQPLILAGDAAGMIAPLSGNGMSMALYGAKILCEIISKADLRSFEVDKIGEAYRNHWKGQFRSRLFVGDILQNASLFPGVVPFLLKMGNLWPKVFKKMIDQTHGDPF